MPVLDLPAESSLVPYAPAPFAASSAAVIAPHPDDEVFGCGAAIAALRAAGAPVRVLLVTDGAGDVADAAERARIAALRTAESRDALSHLGGAEVANAGLPDRGLLGRPAELRDALAAFLARAAAPLVFAPAPCEVHPDHRAVARALLELADAGSLPDATHLAFYEVSHALRPNQLLDATPLLAAKTAAMHAFPSQIVGHDYPRVILGLMAFRSLTLGPSVSAAEAFFVTSVAEIRKRGVESLLRAVGPTEAW